MRTRAGLLLAALGLLLAGGYYSWTAGWRGESAGVRSTSLSPGQERPGSGQHLPAHAADPGGAVQAAQHVESTERVEAVGSRTDVPLMALGWVLDTDGHPLSGATVHVREHEEPEFVIDDYTPFEVAVVTDTEGRFEIPVEYQGQYTVWAVDKERGSTQIEWMQLNPRHPQAEVELRFAPRLVIEGYVTSIDSKPVSGAEVVAFVDVEASGVRLPSGVTSPEIYGRPHTRTNRSGYFRLEPEFSKGAGYVVRAEAPQMTMRTGTGSAGNRFGVREIYRAELSNITPGTSNLFLTLRPPRGPCSLRLRLVCEDGGTPPTSLRAEVQEAGPNGGVYWSRRLSLSVGSDGRFDVDSLVPGARYTIRIPDGLYEEERLLGPFTAAEGKLEVSTVVPGLFTATITINDPKNRLEAGRRIQILRLTESGTRKRIGQPTTSESSELEFSLPTGQLFVQVDGIRSRLTRTYLTRLTESFEMSAGAQEFVFNVP